jgi:cell fate regulator YaaT (PSP1 superfamily)
MNVHDWLMNLPFADPESSCKVVEISFKNGSRKDFYRNATLQHFEKGDLVTLEGTGGYDVGEVSLTGELVRIQMKKKNVDEFSPEMKKILRLSTDREAESYHTQKGREQEMLMRSRAIARQLRLDMKLSEIEIQADGKKATFYYTADDRVDFRELIRIYAGEFKVKVEMRQIGIRQEAAKVGGIGSCGRELCCSTWLNDFKSVTTTAARYQNLSINQTKLSGQCGRLKCCLNYELDTYLDALQEFPDNADTLDTEKGTATLIKKDIFKHLMWYIVPDSTKHYPLTITRVKEIKKLNQQGQKVAELEAVELVGGKIKEVEPQFVDVVGQISLRTLERDSRKRRDKERSNRPQRGSNDAKTSAPQAAPQGRQQGGGRSGQPQKPQQPQQPGQKNTGNRPPRNANAAPAPAREAAQPTAQKEPGQPKQQQPNPNPRQQQRQQPKQQQPPRQKPARTGNNMDNNPPQ